MFSVVSRSPETTRNCLEPPQFVCRLSVAFVAATLTPDAYGVAPSATLLRPRRSDDGIWKQADAMTTKETVRAILDRLPATAASMTCCISCTSFRPSPVATQTSRPVGRCRTSRWTPTCAANGCWAPLGSLG